MDGIYIVSVDVRELKTLPFSLRTYSSIVKMTIAENVVLIRKKQ